MVKMLIEIERFLYAYQLRLYTCWLLTVIYCLEVALAIKRYYALRKYWDGW